MAKIIQDFFQSYTEVSVVPKQIILKPQDPVSSIFYIERGAVRMYGISEEGEEVTINIFQKGAYFPMMLFLADAKNNCFFEATTSTKLRRAPGHAVVDFLLENPQEMKKLLVSFARGINGLTIRIENTLSQNSLAKVASFLHYLGVHAEGNGKQHVILATKVTHSDLAAWLGLARETVSRQIEILEQKKIISYSNGSIEIHDMDLLQQATSPYHSQVS